VVSDGVTVAGVAEASLPLFVYGSLKRGQANHGALKGARFLGVARTAEAFGLREIDGYPALVPGGQAIVGELYELSIQQSSELDEFEGEQYERREIALANGGAAIAYLARAPEAGSPLAGSEWPSRPPRP
jgi:gamma-glutamylaminecyclotransferase